MSDPIDTLVVVGGTSLTVVDAAAVREAAARMDRAANHLEGAAFRATQAARGFDGAAFTAGPASIEPAPHGSLGGPGADAVLAQCAAAPASCCGTLADDARHHARRLRALAQQCTTLRDRLLRVAGLYEYTESTTEHLIGFGVGAAAAAVGGFVSTPIGAVATGVVAGSAAAQGFLWVKTIDLFTDGEASRAMRVALPVVGQIATRKIAPYSDELVAGLGFGVSVAHPVAAGFDFSVTGASTVLSRPLAVLLPPTTATVTEVCSDELTSAGSGTIRTAFDRLNALYAHDQQDWPDVPTGGDGPAEVDGVPAATISVEKVTQADGSVSWVVLIPGMQTGLSATNPLDARSAAEIMGHDPVAVADSAAAVQAAMVAAGIGPDEPVVLIGHSLGGMTAAALSASPQFTSRYTMGGIVTAGSATATFTTPPGVPVLELGSDQEFVTHTDGRSGTESPNTPDRVTVTRDLAASDDPRDQFAAGRFTVAHGMDTQARTLELAIESGNVQVQDVMSRIEPLMVGVDSHTSYYAATRVDEPPAPTPTPSPSPGPPPVETASPEQIRPGLLGTVAPLSGEPSSSGRTG